MSGRSSPSGHRLLDHTADVMIEAWGPSRAACLEEAARALVEVFVDTSSAAASDSIPVAFDEPGDDELLVTVLEEVIYLVDALGAVPVGVALDDTESGGVAGGFEVVHVGDVDTIGPVPKGVSRSGLELRADPTGWHARAVVDV